MPQGTTALGKVAGNGNAMNILMNPQLTDDERRESLYAGDLIVLQANEASLRLCALAREMLQDAFAPHPPEKAQYSLPVERYVEILAELKPAFIHHPECKELLPRILAAYGCDLEKTYFDVPRLRTSTADGYLTSGIAYAFHPHRDTWYSAPQCQVNWWIPVYDITCANGMAFYPKYFSGSVKNSSRTYNYYRWNEESRAQAAQQIGKDTRVQPRAEEAVDLTGHVQLITEVGGMTVFSGAQLHASAANESDRARISIDFRTVHVDDVRDQRGAPNVDSECTGTTLRDFLRCSDLQRLDADLIEPYDVEEVSANATTVYDPRLS